LLAWPGGGRPRTRVGRRDAHGVDGHFSVLVRARRLGQVVRRELVELIQEAWLTQTSRRRVKAWQGRTMIRPLIE
jgi:hypothetical protein